MVVVFADTAIGFVVPIILVPSLQEIEVMLAPAFPAKVNLGLFDAVVPVVTANMAAGV